MSTGAREEEALHGRETIVSTIPERREEANPREVFGSLGRMEVRSVFSPFLSLNPLLTTISSQGKTSGSAPPRTPQVDPSFYHHPNAALHAFKVRLPLSKVRLPPPCSVP